MKILLSTFLLACSVSCYAQFEIEEDATFLNSAINRVGIGTEGNAGSPSARLNVRSSNNVDNGGLISILSTLETEGKFGVVSKVAEADDKAFAVFLSNKEDETKQVKPL